MADHIDIALPFVLILIAFLLKLFMDRNATLPLVIRSLFELPVDIVSDVPFLKSLPTEDKLLKILKFFCVRAAFS
jgi:hypothetical protein